MGYVTAIVPSVGVLIIFWIAIRAMVSADRRERIAQARIELAQDAAELSAQPGSSGTAGEGSGSTGLGSLGRMGDSEHMPFPGPEESPDQSGKQ